MTRTQIVLEPGRADKDYWRTLFAYRELLGFLAWRDVSVHYKQTAVGVAWAVIRPLLTTAIMAFVFGRVAKLQADGDAWYPLFVLAGTVGWFFFAGILNTASESLVANANLVGKVYFPRMLVPLSSVGVAGVDLLVTLPVLGLLMAYAGHAPPPQVVLAPLFLLFAAATALGLGLLLCALNVRYRDVRYALPFVVQFGVYVSPVGYRTAEVQAQYQWLYHLNPMVFAIDGLRWTLLGVGDPFAGGCWVASVAVTALFGWAGVRYFRATEKTFADVI